MNIVNIDYGMSDKTYSIFLSGCKSKVKCEGCFNPESWDFNAGNSWLGSLKRIREDINLFKGIISKILIVGGEPLDQDLGCLQELINFLKALSVPVCLFTHYSFDAVPGCIKDSCDYVKCGSYIPSLKCSDNVQYGIKLATSNQKIYKKGIDY